MRESPVDPARSKNQGMYGISMRENRDSPGPPVQVITGWAAQGTLRRYATDTDPLGDTAVAHAVSGEQDDCGAQDLPVLCGSGPGQAFEAITLTRGQDDQA